MAIKKNELYSSLWASCDKLRGGMDASQYKDYILTLLFVKYVTDKFKGVRYAEITVPEGGSFDDMVALKGHKNIGEGLDMIIARLAEANELRGVIDNARFNDETKLGKGQEMVDKLTGLVAIFQRPEFDFRNNRAGGDDILGDAYEYLMRHFAQESGKSKGQFYTPAEVSRILAKVVGIDRIPFRDEGYTVYDPACGSGSLLIRAADEAPFEIAIYGQEKEVATAGLAKMNLVLHNKATGEIRAANTFSDPRYFEEGADGETLKRFDFAVVNPPFSLKNWKDGLKNFGRFEGYGDAPPEKNGDFAWLLHILKSLKSTGRAAVILPHGVLFRGNAEAAIREAIIGRGYIEGIIGLPPNLFYGTGIPACIIVIDKKDAAKREGIFMIDAGRDFIKDGNKNRLRERDIFKIVSTYTGRVTDDPSYARFVPLAEITEKNGCNLNIPRYIAGSEPEDEQDIAAHLQGGIPVADVETLSHFWVLFPGLKDRLFSPLRPGYFRLNVVKDEARAAILGDPEFAGYAAHIYRAFDDWQREVEFTLRHISQSVDMKRFIADLAEKLLAHYQHIELIDKYDVYEALLSYWGTVMSDDVFLLKYDGYTAGREIEFDVEISEGKRGKKEKVKGWEGKLIPKVLIERECFAAERKKIAAARRDADGTQSHLDELLEEQSGEDSVFADCLSDRDAVDAKAVAAKLKRLKWTAPDGEETKILDKYTRLVKKLKEQLTLVKCLEMELDLKVQGVYPQLSEEEIKDFLVVSKWCASIWEGIEALYVSASHSLANRVVELAERYEEALPEIEREVAEYEAKVKGHLERMGFVW